MEIIIGNQYKTNYCGTLTVLEKKKGDMYLIEFTDTKFRKFVRGSQIREKCVRDPMRRSLCGVACIGNIRTKGVYAPFYSIWHDMMNRCYNPNNKRHNSYQNVSVCDRWLVFENFYNDCKNIDGFDFDKIVSGELVLDKDVKQRFSATKIYSKDTCCWILKEDNNKIQDSQQKLFYALSPNNIKYSDTNITNFAKTHSLNRKNISGALHGRAKTVHGWKFSYEDIA